MGKREKLYQNVYIVTNMIAVVTSPSGEGLRYRICRIQSTNMFFTYTLHKTRLELEAETVVFAQVS